MTMACRHLLIKFSGSRNPVSRRTNASTSGVTAEAAQAELQQYVDKIAAEGNTEEVFAKYSKERSDCGSFKQGGDLGEFGPGDMQKQFEDATKATEVGKISPSSSPTQATTSSSAPSELRGIVHSLLSQRQQVADPHSRGEPGPRTGVTQWTHSIASTCWSPLTARPV
eukprot:CAMPEP_0206156844 /NCGR_PEP_ID=MMETSP1474-20131121/3371_1 /ASSEMBLY_ACC=CAM_ASM_001110 /TAXON_ID=97495 /ORGANISM="Imantonia sp., Strain RCC918" /LENGTH=167 /DNA_ID=CAMNT_0053556131 /DNA_START=41 /DNA_END=542 /DNA_ORIENTATION=-